MITLVLFVLDMLDKLSVPWWLYLIAVLGAPLEVIIGAAIIENVD